MVDRLIESANAIPEQLLHDLHQLQMLRHHLECKRATIENRIWPECPPKPETLKHIFHNDIKVLIATIECQQDIDRIMMDAYSNIAERLFIDSHVTLKNIRMKLIRGSERTDYIPGFTKTELSLQILRSDTYQLLLLEHHACCMLCSERDQNWPWPPLEYSGTTAEECERDMLRAIRNIREHINRCKVPSERRAEILKHRIWNKLQHTYGIHSSVLSTDWKPK